MNLQASLQATIESPRTSGVTPSGRNTAVMLAQLMDESFHRPQTPALGTNTAWALKLKNCVDAVARELHVDVLSAKPVQAFGPEDDRDMLFEVKTSRGSLEVLRNRSGLHTFYWK